MPGLERALNVSRGALECAQATFSIPMAATTYVSEAALARSLPKGFAIDHGSFVGPVTVVDEAKTGASPLSGAEVKAVYRSYTPSKAASAAACDSLDEKHCESSTPSKNYGARTPDSVESKSLGDSPHSVSSCSVASGSPAPASKDAARPVLIVIDNDECIGSWGECSRACRWPVSGRFE